MLTINSLANQYLKEFVFDYAESTRETTARAFRYLVLAIGNKRIDRVRQSDFEQYKRWLIESTRSKTTVNIYLRSLAPVFEYAVARKLIAVNPIRGVRQFRVTRQPVKVYEPWQIERMVRFARSPQWRALIPTAFVTGLRRGALLNLTKENIRNGFVYVEPKRLTKVTWPWDPKTRETRKVPIPDQIAAMIRSLDCFYPFLTAACYDGILQLQQAGLLVARVRKCPIQNFWRCFKAIQVRAFGYKLGDFHMLRKSYTTMMAGQFPEYFVKQLTGIRSSKTLTHYLASRESQYDVARQIAHETIKNGAGGLLPGSKRRSA